MYGISRKMCEKIKADLGADNAKDLMEKASSCDKLSAAIEGTQKWGAEGLDEDRATLAKLGNEKKVYLGDLREIGFSRQGVTFNGVGSLCTDLFLSELPGFGTKPAADDVNHK